MRVVRDYLPATGRRREDIEQFVFKVGEIEPGLDGLRTS